MDLDVTTKQHLKYLIGLSIITKIALVILTVFVLGSIMDMFAIVYYYENAMSVFSNHILYIDYYYEYPILLFIPVLIALVPSLILHSIMVFSLVFSGLMILCDTVTIMCIYLISRKIWNKPKTAFIAALIYMTALAVQYFAMLDCSSFAVMFMMIGLTMLFYGKEIAGISWMSDYLAIILGYFAKIFPFITLPFIILYKSKTTSLKQEIISVLKIIIPVSVILILPLLIFNPASVIKTYIPMRLDIGYFSNTIIWTLYVWLHDIFGVNIVIGGVLLFIYVCMGVGLSTVFYFAFKYQKQEPVVLLKFILWTIAIIVLSFKVRSPNYILWFAPFVCILIADNVYKIGLFYITQLLAYIEFPLAFALLWENARYTNPIYSTNWYLALLLFTLEFSTLLILIWLAVEPIKLYKNIFRTDVNLVS